MTQRKYIQGKQITSMADFENSKRDYFIVHFGNTARTKHRAFLISWQYRVLSNFIVRGRVFEAERIKSEVGGEN